MVATVHTHMGLAANRMTMMVCMDQLVQATRAKIQDVRNDCPGRPIILVGFNAGAALACQVGLFLSILHNFFFYCQPFFIWLFGIGSPDGTHNCCYLHWISFYNS